MLDASAASAAPSASPSAPGKKTVQPEGRSARAASESAASTGRPRAYASSASASTAGARASRPIPERTSTSAQLAGSAPGGPDVTAPDRAAALTSRWTRCLPRLAPGLDEMEARTAAEHAERIDEHPQSGARQVPADVSDAQRPRQPWKEGPGVDPVGNQVHLAAATAGPDSLGAGVGGDQHRIGQGQALPLPAAERLLQHRRIAPPAEEQRQLGGGEPPRLVDQDRPTRVAEHRGTHQRVGGVHEDVRIRIELALHRASERLHLLEQGARGRRNPQHAGSEQRLRMGEGLAPQREREHPVSIRARPHALRHPPCPRGGTWPHVEPGQEDGWRIRSSRAAGGG